MNFSPSVIDIITCISSYNYIATRTGGSSMNTAFMGLKFFCDYSIIEATLSKLGIERVSPCHLLYLAGKIYLRL